jgi:hypothetical protein
LPNRGVTATSAWSYASSSTPHLPLSSPELSRACCLPGFFRGSIQGQRSSTTSAQSPGRAGRLGKALIISQVAISLILLEGAGLFLRTLESLKSFNPGFDKVAVWEFDLSPVQHDNQPAAIDTYRRQLTESIASLPSVKSVAFSSVPVLGADFAWKDTVSRLPNTNPSDAVAAAQVVVSPGFFRTLGIPLLTGRDSTWSDDKNHPPVAIIGGRPENPSARFPRGERAPASRLFCGLLGWCREGESNPQDPKVGGF